VRSEGGAECLKLQEVNETNNGGVGGGVKSETMEGVGIAKTAAVAL
jgi:hypothetical protein